MAELPTSELINAALTHVFSGDVNYANCTDRRGTTRVWKLKEQLPLLCLVGAALKARPTVQSQSLYLRADDEYFIVL